MSFFQGLKAVTALGTKAVASAAAVDLLGELEQAGYERTARAGRCGIVYAWSGRCSEPELKGKIEGELKAGWELAKRNSLSDLEEIAEATLLNVESTINERYTKVLERRLEPRKSLETAAKRAEAVKERNHQLKRELGLN